MDLKTSILEIACASKRNVKLLPTAEAFRLIEKLSLIFDFELKNKWLWENSQNKHKHSVVYSNDSWEMIFTERLEIFGERIYLAVTDDDVFPWDVVCCEKNDLIFLLREMPLFEYFIFDEEMKGVLFDTHNNDLILLGVKNNASSI